MYIRTKNRIYEVESTLRDDGIIKGYNVGEMAFIRKDQVIDQSENLEDLCDEFVARDTIDGTRGFAKLAPKITSRKPSIIEARKMNTVEYWKVYGAIWTPKGLIFVAIMNKNGDLEFIEA